MAGFRPVRGRRRRSAAGGALLLLAVLAIPAAGWTIELSARGARLRDGVDEDYDMLAQIESSRMSWCLADVQNVFGGGQKMSGGNGLWGPARSAVIYPDIQPAAIQERSVPRVNQNYLNNQPIFMDGVPVGAADSYDRGDAIRPIEAPLMDSAQSQWPSTEAQPVGFRTQVPNTQTQGGR